MTKRSSRKSGYLGSMLGAMMILAVAMSLPALADSISVDAYDAGTLRPIATRGPDPWGASQSTVGPIAVSIDDNPTEWGHRSYLKFDLSGVGDIEVVQASLVLEFPSGSYDSKEDKERLLLFEVGADPDTYGFDFSSCGYHSFAWSTYLDLGEGDTYGVRTYRSGMEGTTTTISLTQAAIEDINDAIAGDGEFAIGGRLTWEIHEDYGTTDAVDPDQIFTNTGEGTDYDLCYGTPSAWTTRRLELTY